MKHQDGKLVVLPWRWFSWLAIFAVLLLVVDVARSQQAAPTIAVTVNKSLVFRLAQKAKRVSITQPEIADVVVVAPNQLLINGKAVGTTSLVVFDAKGTVTNYDLIVSPDIAALRMQLKAIFPEENINISTSGPAIVLKGEVSNEVVYDKVLKIAQTYLPPKPPSEVAPAATQSLTVSTPGPQLPATGTAFAGGGQLAFTEETSLTDVDRWGNRRRIPGIIDLLVIRDVRQIQVDVIVAEISLDKLREAGIDFLFNIQSGGQSISSFSGAGSQGGLTGSSLLTDPSTFPPTTTFGGATSGVTSILSGKYNLTAVYRLFQNKDITEILSKPSLVIKNGRSGGFLAGGEFPIFVENALGTDTTSTVEFKPFGVRLDFLPTITWSGTIDMRVFPEVSEIDQSVAVRGIPGLKVRRTVSRVEMKEGEALIIAGLLDKRILKDMTKFPILGDIPILGALFRTTRFRNQETELVFVVTPKIVKALKPGVKPKIPSIEKYYDPDMRQVPLPGKPSAPGRGRAAPGGPTMP
ncbi:MAG: type II and III secretion system protein family protein [Candidatus Binatia bacterium]